MPLAEALEYHVSTAIQLVARCVKMRALGAMGAAGTLPGDRITGIAPSLVVLKNVGEVP